ncbi:MAG: excinuclease ABC subunit B, partial [Candidatus Staskawiczbacteria bacterium RIFCSPLOWO2_01_FULL_33_9]
MPFKLISKFKPKGDQPQAIAKLTKNLKSGKNHQVLLGVTGSGKTFTMASVIQKIQKPTLIISPNKTLAAQLYQEFKEFFPNNAIHYFVSYYDYYQPEAYIVQSDTYIEKDAKINEEIDRLRHSAAQDVLSRKDVIVIASVSCIYNIGSPENYRDVSLDIKLGQKIKRRDFLLRLTNLQYKRNDISPVKGSFRARGDIIDIYLVTGENILKVYFLGEKISNIALESVDFNSHKKTILKNYKLFPANFWVAPQNKINVAIENIKTELQNRLKELNKQKRILEAQRLEQRTNYDLEMLQEVGYCHGIENYSSQLEFRKPGSPPFSLVDYFKYFNPEGFLMFIDESHISMPQIKAMSVQDRARKETLIDFGFRLPSAVDNRPLKLPEFEKIEKQIIYVSATPNEYEKEKSGKNIIEQLIRPTGLLEPSIEIKKTENQIKDLI